MRRACCARRRQDGVAAIELALILLFFISLLPVVLLFGRALFMYTAVQKSAQDAARFMATLPLQQMTSEDTANQAAIFATQLVQQALAETGPLLKANLIRVECVYAEGDYPCGSYDTRPLQVRVKFVAKLPIDFLPGLTMGWLPRLKPISLQANTVQRYAN
ncbi:TadE/TadG family type IV pilus assembly protein [Janthinobacterium sp. PC23-8]|uniref:TadE/TadG family type IV pilus assembly protein n=1 Tax=Janthinobacterium sp. PC23-8 TaxID=2012679 RepID=UPI00159597FF|nr:TadE/TadG family type IV pilus assembly protein [Janthinobacterium sp. PC23-8]